MTTKSPCLTLHFIPEVFFSQNLMGHFFNFIETSDSMNPIHCIFLSPQNKTSIALQILICGTHCFPWQIQTLSTAGQVGFRIENLCSPIGLPQKGSYPWFNGPIAKILVILSLNISFISETELDNGACVFVEEMHLG